MIQVSLYTTAKMTHTRKATSRRKRGSIESVYGKVYGVLYDAHLIVGIVLWTPSMTWCLDDDMLIIYFIKWFIDPVYLQITTVICGTPVPHGHPNLASASASAPPSSCLATHAPEYRDRHRFPCSRARPWVGMGWGGGAHVSVNDSLCVWQ